MPAVAQGIAPRISIPHLLEKPLIPSIPIRTASVCWSDSDISSDDGTCLTYGSQTSPASSSVSGRSDDSGYGTGRESQHAKPKAFFNAPKPSDCHSNPRRSRENRFTPPSLPSQQESSECFVKLLICYATGLIASIWPLSECGGISLLSFISETLRRSKTSYSTLQLALYYIVLLKEHVPDRDFTREQPHGPRRLALQCGRRMFLTAIILAGKYLQDKNYSTLAWEKIAGLDSLELNRNERLFLQAIDYRLHVTKETFASWAGLVVRTCEHTKIVRPIHPCEKVRIRQCREDWNRFMSRLTPDVIGQQALADSLDLLLQDNFNMSVFEFPPDLFHSRQRLPTTAVSGPQSCEKQSSTSGHSVARAERPVPPVSTAVPGSAIRSNGLMTPLRTPVAQLNDSQHLRSFLGSASFTALQQLKPAATVENLPGPPPLQPTARGMCGGQNVATPLPINYEPSPSKTPTFVKVHGTDYDREDVVGAEALLSILAGSPSNQIALRPNNSALRKRKCGNAPAQSYAGIVKRSTTRQSTTHPCASANTTLQNGTRTLLLDSTEEVDDVLPDALPVQGQSMAVNKAGIALHKDAYHLQDLSQNSGSSASFETNSLATLSRSNSEALGSSPTISIDDEDEPAVKAVPRITRKDHSERSSMFSYTGNGFGASGPYCLPKDKPSRHFYQPLSFWEIVAA